MNLNQKLKEENKNSSFFVLFDLKYIECYNTKQL